MKDHLVMVKPIVPGSLDALTIFKGMKGWQISWQVAGQRGYSVNQVDESVARRFFDLLSGQSTEPPKITYLQKTRIEIMTELLDNLKRLNRYGEDEI